MKQLPPSLITNNRPKSINGIFISDILMCSILQAANLYKQIEDDE